MNENENMQYNNLQPVDQDEMEIDLADLFAKILRKWKFILVMTLAFMIVVGGFLSYRNYNSIKNAYNDQSKAGLEQQMTAGQIQNVEQLFNRYLTFKERINNNQFYLDNSILMKMDPNNISNYNMEYLVESPVQNVFDSFTDYTLGVDEYKQIAEILGGDTDPRYVYEIVTIRGTSTDEASGTAIDTDEIGSRALKGTIANTYSGIVTVSIKANDQDTCKKIAEIVDTAVLAHEKTLADAGVELSLKKLDGTYTESVDRALAEKQQSTIAQGSELVSSYTKFEKDNTSSLSEEEQALFKYLINSNDQKQDHVHWKKWCVLGAVAGMGLALVLLVLSYLLKPGLKTPDDVARVSGLKTLGYLQEEEHPYRGLSKLFNNWARKIETRQFPDSTQEEQIKVACARIIAGCKNSGYDSVYLIQGFHSEFADKSVQVMKEKLESVIGNVGVGSPAFDADDLKELEKSKAAVLVASVENSKEYTIRQNMQVAKECGVTMMGNVIVKEN